MNLDKLKEIIKLSSQPAWALRDPDQEQIVSPTEQNKAPGTPPMPKIPVLPGQPPQKPGVINSKAMGKAADAILGVKSPVDTSPTSPDQQTAMPSLSESLRTRMASRKINPTLPGSIYNSGGF